MRGALNSMPSVRLHGLLLRTEATLSLSFVYTLFMKSSVVLKFIKPLTRKVRLVGS